jgi:hypothetical protein
MTYKTKINLPVGLRAMDLLDTPVWNKGSAFDDHERTVLGLQGLPPPHVESLQEQAVRAYEAFNTKKTDLGRHIYLRQLQDSNETASRSRSATMSSSFPQSVWDCLPHRPGESTIK